MRTHRFVILILLFSSLSASPVWALFELSAESRKGGRDLRFDTGLATQTVREEDLTVSAETDRAVPYRIYMTFLAPLTNEQGKTLPLDALYVFSPTNALGDLRTKLETPLRLGQEILYTSNSAGTSDQFTLVFHLNLPPDMPGGVYRSTLSFTMEPVTPVSGLTPRTVTIQLRAESKPAFRMSIRSEKGGERLDMGRVTKKGPPPPAILRYQIESNIGQSYRVFQELRGPLISEAGTVLPEDAIQFSVDGVSEGKGNTGKLASSPVLVYESDPGGGPAQFNGIYSVEVPPTTPAGRFSGMLLIRTESSSPYAAGQAAQLPVQFEIEPIFNLDIDIPDGFGLQFGNLKSGEEAAPKRVFLKVRTNLGQPYQVSQVVMRKMSTLDGAALPEDAFRYSVQKPATGSVTAIAQRPVPPGESSIFLSDSTGTPEEIALVYTLTVPLEAKAGPYGTEIKYSITTL